MCAASAVGAAVQAPQPEKKKILMVYYSRTGNTKRVAEDFASRTGADIEALTDLKNRAGLWQWFVAGKDAFRKHTTALGPTKYAPAAYDLVVVATPVWAGDMTPAVRTYLMAHKNAIKNVAFFVTAGSAKQEKIPGSLETLAGKKPLGFAIFSKKELTDTAIYERTIISFINSVLR